MRGDPVHSCLSRKRPIDLHTLHIEEMLHSHQLNFARKFTMAESQREPQNLIFHEEHKETMQRAGLPGNAVEFASSLVVRALFRVRCLRAGDAEKGLEQQHSKGPPVLLRRRRQVETVALMRLRHAALPL